MKVVLSILIMLLLAASAQATDVGVSISVGQPGFYGRIDIGNAPRPELIYTQPVIIAPPPQAVEAPIYLRVPPGHAKHWKKHCHEYNACGRPVYFVRDKWYNDTYVPHYQKHREEYQKERHGEGGDRKDDRRDDRRDDRGSGSDKGHPGHEHGHGHDRD